jgi:hypothetical protein
VMADWTSQLAPDHAPPAASWWPPAPGWWVIAAGLLVIAALALIVVYRRDPFRRHRRAALRELERIEKWHADAVLTARAIQGVMRRYAVSVFGVARVGRLSGESWLSFVAEQGGVSLAGAPGRSLLTTAFANGSRTQDTCWLSGAREFVRRAARGRRKR